MKIKCNECETDITEQAQGCSSLNCPKCGQLVNGFGQCLTTEKPDEDYAGEEYYEEEESK